MIDSEKLTSCINDMVRDGHTMESCEFVHPNGVYSIKFKKLKKKPADKGSEMSPQA